MTSTTRTHPKAHFSSSHTQFVCFFFLLNSIIKSPQCISAVAKIIPEVSMGTTILAVRYKYGVIVAADTRTSVSGYVSNRFASKLTFVLDRDVDCFDALPYHFGRGNGKEEEKVIERSATMKEEEKSADNNNSSNHNIISQPRIPLTEASTCCICRSGSAADTQYLADKVRSELVSRQVLYRTRGTVTNAARLLRSMLVDDPDMSAGLICAGYDHVLQRGVIYSISPGGSLFELPEWAAGGSGSSYILGHIDAHIPHGEATDTWEEEDAVEFVIKAIELAMDRDGSSGGFVRLYVINRWGKKSIVRLPRSAARLFSLEGDDGNVRKKSVEVLPSKNGVVLKGFASPSQI